ncbi:unnamed protein product [Effrenium voratum]|nr:unnamed protein product [Effrenium voratum]
MALSRALLLLLPALAASAATCKERPHFQVVKDKPVPAATLAYAQGKVAGDKAWMCPEVDLEQCPLSFVGTGFSNDYVQCGVAGKYCVSMGPVCQPRRGFR